MDVETVRFDEYEARHPMHVDVVKIDVEDFEADVLEGMRGIICRDRPFIVCEILPRLHGNQRTQKSSQLLTTNHTGLLPQVTSKFRGSISVAAISPISCSRPCRLPILSSTSSMFFGI